MSLQRGKAILEGNIFPKINQEWVVQGMPSPIKLITRDEITMEMSGIELADKTQVPGGRNNFGEFNATIQLADDKTREPFLTWYRDCTDRGAGVSPNYKRDSLVRYRRLFQGTPAAEYAGAGTAGRPFIMRLQGTWIKSVTFPDFDLSGGDEGDSDSNLQVVICYDDVIIDESGLAGQIGGNVTNSLTQLIGIN